MDAIAIVNEILYIISSHEKGKVFSKKLWKNKRRKLLLESLYSMELLVDFLVAPEKEQSIEKMLFILNFIDKNKNIIFPESERLNDLRSNFLTMKHGREEITSKHNEVISLMQKIIEKCKNERKTKTIFCLLMAFHNLPRSFFKTNVTPLFNCPVLPITPEEALEMAELWLNKSGD